MSHPDPLSFFRLKQVHTARVSEISEATADAPIPPEERINFHIGNPLQDTRLSSAFLRLALGIDLGRQDVRETDDLLEYLGWARTEKPKLEFLRRVIEKSAPYMPRGGYQRQHPPALIEAFQKWLEHQQEPLQYDTGEKSGRREIILASGGIHETLRILLTALARYLQMRPARILCYRYDFPAPYRTIPHLLIESLARDERAARAEIEQWLTQPSPLPTFLIIGDALSEATRRALRLLCIQSPLFFIEANNAPNHHSLAREAKLTQRVLRLLTPAIFAPRLATLSTVFVIGNADFLSVIENVHFELKGTPSASEVEFLSFLLEQNLAERATTAPAEIFPDATWRAEWQVPTAEAALARLATRVEERVAATIRVIEQHLPPPNKWHTAIHHTQYAIRNTRYAIRNMPVDELASHDTLELFDQLIQNAPQSEWCATLQRSFLSVFVQHQPQYDARACLVTSGSARTALGLLGFHCGITDVLIPDLSWSYEQCFPSVHVVPLTPDLTLDVEAMIAKLEQLCYSDPHWHTHGAVVINNPHNATGRIFAEADVRRLMTYCLQRGIYVIDDLAYQNVAPVDDLPLIKTARQIATDLVEAGIITQTQSERVITVHALSKTDCLAGARLAVVEIREPLLRERYREVNDLIAPNLAAIFIAYLFYRGAREGARTYWRLRNALFQERTQALLAACENLPPDRNPFGLTIVPPAGSMYPLLRIAHLPNGLSLDWLASALARRGIGLLPLATFARTEAGFEMGRRAFRLTLGGTDSAEQMQLKTRRLLIDLNRLIAEEDAHYNRKQLTFHLPPSQPVAVSERLRQWDALTRQMFQHFESRRAWRELATLLQLDGQRLRRDFLADYLPERLQRFRTRLEERARVSDELMQRATAGKGEWLAERLAREFMKDSLARRQEAFRQRTYDRTVHPTQKYSLQAEMTLDAILRALIARQPVPLALVERAGQELLYEFVGQNVAITSQLEADEILTDLDTLLVCEAYTELFTETTLRPFLSFWSDWDGSSRPSGQGHRLIAAAVMENVQRMAQILSLLHQADPHLALPPDLLVELERLPQRRRRFTALLNNITQLTHQLEQRYRGILPYALGATPLERLAVRLHLRRDPLKVLWEHNDRYEQKMLELREQRRHMLDTYFALNKRIRKQLYALIPDILAHRASEPLLRCVVDYRDILQRMVITPRIHQGMITARDPFAIDTTVFNMQEINAIAGTYGNPGMTLALQISFATQPEALIALDRKMRNQMEQTRRRYPHVELPFIWLIPLLEDIETVTNIPTYLDRLWDYATQSRHTDQSPQARLAEILPEVFIAGSDLSQQISQPSAAFQYRKAKYVLQTWLAEHGLADTVRVKMGSGEPMQRQGAYYSPVSGQPAFVNVEPQRRRLARALPPAAQKSTAYAVTPLQGIFLGGDLRTYQSSLAEDLRFLPVRDLANLLYHVREAQAIHRKDLQRAAETLTESRMVARSRGAQELERLTRGLADSLYEEFLIELTKHFRHILYGRPEDLFGIHIVAYFIGRSIPQLRDRPASRRRAMAGLDRSQQILASVAEMIPLSQQGSMLRAIVHNQAQTTILGINQLTTGLFRALEYYAQKTFPEATREQLIAERILPHLPVYEILHTLRVYQDWRGEFVQRIEPAFPAGNSAFVALREDADAMHRFLPLFQQELVRRHGLNVNDLVENGVVIPNLLPALRPDLAVLLQDNLFNTDLEQMLQRVNGKVDAAWQKQVAALLQVPEQVRQWRSIIWDVLGDSLYQRVQSFTELATALHAVKVVPSPVGSIVARGPKLPTALTGFLRSARVDDEMRQFMLGAVEQLSRLTEDRIEVPVSVIRAMNDVERLAQIEETALSPEKQNVLRYCLLQIARLVGENG
jgi:aspartate/methionine/tyrosine aminotransferase